jgi:hypothetical protein
MHYKVEGQHGLHNWQGQWNNWEQPGKDIAVVKKRLCRYRFRIRIGNPKVLGKPNGNHSKERKLN